MATADYPSGTAIHARVLLQAHVVETLFLPPLVPTCRGAAPVKSSTRLFESLRKQFETSTAMYFKNLLMPLFLMGCFPVDFQEAKWPLRM